MLVSTVHGSFTPNGAGGDDLRTGTGWRAAVFSYNHSRTYVREVFDRAVAFAG